MPDSNRIQELRNKVQNLIGKYEERLTSVGIKLTVSKKYFETVVYERTPYRGIANAIDYIRERKYNHERNKYHCLILLVLPMDASLVRKESCKEYAFVLRKVERAHIGQKPQQSACEENKLLRKIEKRILKTIQHAEKNGVQKTCTDTFLDAIRYLSPKYGYKSNVLGKARSSWALIFALMIVMLAIVMISVVRIISIF